MKTINLEPTDEGYGNIALLFADSIGKNALVRRQKETFKLLDMLVQLVAYLAVKDPQKLESLQKFLGERAK